MQPKTVCLIGATGLVGAHTLRYLLANQKFSKVIVLTRRPLEDQVVHPKLETHVIDFDRLHEPAIKHFIKADVAICALGTTMAEAKTREAFRKVDYDYPTTFARLALENGVRAFLLISSIGASATSPVFYARVKGETEKALLHYAFESIGVLRPSLLLGKRTRPRPLESLSGKWAEAFSFLWFGKWKKYQPIAATQVARALVNMAWLSEAGKKVVESDEIKKIAEQRHWV